MTRLQIKAEEAEARREAGTEAEDLAGLVPTVTGVATSKADADHALRVVNSELEDSTPKDLEKGVVGVAFESVPASHAAREAALLVDAKMASMAVTPPMSIQNNGAATQQLSSPGANALSGDKANDPLLSKATTTGTEGLVAAALRVDTAMAKLARERGQSQRSTNEDHPSVRYAMDDSASPLPDEKRIPPTLLRRGGGDHNDTHLNISQNTQPGAVPMGADVELPTRDEEITAAIDSSNTRNAGQGDTVEGQTPVEALLSATLVDLEEEEQEVIEAKPALEGFQALIHNSRFRVVMVLVIVVILAIAVPLLVISQRSNETTVFVPAETNETNPFLECGSYEKQRSDYRGTINVTASGKPCLRWDEAHASWRTTPQKYPEAGLEENYCRSGGADEHSSIPFCYVDADSSEICNVPFCEGIGKNLTCGTAAYGQTDYRGTINVTINGRTCQHWDQTTPHQHSQNHSSLEANYCRNFGDDPKTWCYTTDPDLRWEYCNVPLCTEEDPIVSIELTAEPCYNCTVQECGTEAADFADYRGPLNVTISGRTCQQWDVHEPHAHYHLSSVTYPGRGLEDNYCRNPDGQPATWCFTTDPDLRWEYCSVPACKAPQSTVCGTLDTQQRNYRGTVNVTESGLACQRWDKIRPHSHFNHPVLQPDEGLEENYCRNPPPKYNKDLGDNPIEGARAWCYTEEKSKVWEYCTVPFCEAADTPSESKSCGSRADSQTDYRGTQSVTKSGYTCQSWDQQVPHTHSNTPDSKPFAGLEENYCRNPDGESSVWCYTTDPEKRWDYCDVPFCEDIQTPLVPRTSCGTLSQRQEDYRGALAVSRSGSSCLAWSNQSFYFHGYTKENYPEAGLGDNNFCRNPDSSLGPWCFVADSELGTAKKELCVVPSCEDEEKHRTCGALDRKQMDYRGFLNQSATGLACQPWDLGEASHVNPAKYPTGGLEENYCRNPDGRQDRAWCYTEAGREVCSVPDCAAEIHYSCGTTAENQRDYRGDLNITVSGKLCQPWDSQQPHGHPFSLQANPEEGLNGNYCRNPNGADEKAWCYTMDPDTLWEYCNVPWC